MNLSNIIVEGGLMHRAAEDYEDQRSRREHDTKVRALGLRRMQGEDKLLDKDIELKALRQQIDASEMEFKKMTQGGRQATEEAELAVKRGAAETARELMPGQRQIATATQQEQVKELREKQAANIWLLMRGGDQQGALEALSKSELIHPGRKFKAIVPGQAPARGPDGQPQLGPDGKPVVENVLQLVPADGGEPIFVPQARLDAMVAKHYSKIEKVGNNLVRIGPGGSVAPVYEGAGEVDHIPDSGDLYYKKGPKVGQRIPAAGGIGPRPDPAPGSNAAKRIDDRVKMAIDKVIMPKYGGRFEGGLFFPEEANKDVALRATQIVGELVRGGMNPEAAGAEAVKRADREKTLKDAGKGGSGDYTGPTPWKR